MARSHSKNTIIKIGATDLSAFCNTSSFEQSLGEEDVTVYGTDDQLVDGGIASQKFSLGGFYGTGVSGPKAKFEAAMDTGTVTAFTRQVEGTGSGKPQEEFNGLVTKYVETAPVAGYVTWSADITVSGGVTRTTQS